jgi:hypothetical protein
VVDILDVLQSSERIDMIRRKPAVQCSGGCLTFEADSAHTAMSD